MTDINDLCLYIRQVASSSHSICMFICQFIEKI